jgi:hypothetical protein
MNTKSLVSKMSRPSLQPIQRVPRTRNPVKKRSEREAHPSPPLMAEANYECSRTSAPVLCHNMHKDELYSKTIRPVEQ